MEAIMKKTINKFACVALSALMLAGCAGEADKETTAAQTTTTAANQTTTAAEQTEAPTEPETTTEPAPEEVINYDAGLETVSNYVSAEAMAEADKWSFCDDTALAAVMKKAEAGEDITVAVIGGSITQGTISSGSTDSEVGFKTCYADLFFKWWTEMFPDVNVTTINAGIGATGSYLAVNRVQADVLDYNPDIVLVEFAVNDAGIPSSRTTYENLLRNIMASDSQPAVLCLFMGQTNGSTDQEKELIIASNYKLPMVSYINAITYMMNNNIYTAEQLSGDTVHPSAMGHAIIGELLYKYLNNAYSNREIYGEYAGFAKEDVIPVTKDKYSNGRILDSKSITPSDAGTFVEANKFYNFPNDWTTDSEDADSYIEFKAEFKNLGILFLRTTNGKSGQFEVLVDGEVVTTLNADFSGGWGNYAEATEVFAGEEVAEHTVVIKKAADSTGNLFSILGLLVSE